MIKPLALVGYLGPNNVLTRASSLVATELAAMAKMLEEYGYDVALCKTDETPSKVKAPETGLKIWDNKTQPHTVWLHAACVNIPGGLAPVHLKSADALAKALPNARRIYRLVIDLSNAMTHRQMLNTLRAKGRKSGYVDNWREAGPNESYQAIFDAVTKAEEEGRFYEVGYDVFRAKDRELPFLNCNLTTKQLEITAELFPKAEKQYDFCYIGSSRSCKKKQAARLEAIGEELLAHEPAFYGGSLFKTATRFNKAWEAMSASKAHLIARDEGMDQQPLHRYIQALINDAIPVCVGEPEPVGYIHDPELQELLRVSSYQEAVALVEDYDNLLPKLRKELAYWQNFDREIKDPL